MKKLFFLVLLVFPLALFLGCGLTNSTASFNQATIAKFDDILNSAKTSAGAQGMILGIWSPGKGDYLGTAGTGDIDTGAAMSPQKLFRIASVSKTFTATVILQLVDEGLISLDDKIAQYVSGVPNGNLITIRMLLNHTSGLPSYTDSSAFWRAIESNRSRQFTPQELLDYGFALPLKSQPGGPYHYSNNNYILLGLIIEKVNREGETLEQAVERRVINRIGLAHTFFPTNENFPGDYIHGYQPGQITGAVEDWSLVNPSFAWAAGGIISNIYDLKTYINALYDNSAGLLSPAMQAKKINEDWVGFGADSIPTGKYGLGWAQVGGFFFHDGATIGYHCITAYDPATGTTVVAMLNTMPEDGSTAVLTLIQVIRILFPDRPI